MMVRCLHQSQHRMSITETILLLTLLQGLPPGLLCQRWDFPSEIDGLVGSCVEIPCSVYPESSSTVWYLYRSRGYPQIFNSQESSKVLVEYKDRTSLIRGTRSCSLRIDPVVGDDGEYYYPGIATDRDANAYSLHRRSVWLNITDTPSRPQLSGSRTMFEGRPENVLCYVEHTCGSSPPFLTWNKPGQTKRQSEDLSGGRWREISVLRYIPSPEDDQIQIQCTATYHGGKTLRNGATMDITYAPKDVTVSLPQNTKLVEGSDVILTCTSRSNPPPHTYEWYQTNSKKKSRLQVQINEVRNVSKDTEPYSCAAINTVGRGESPPAKIPVQYTATGVQVIELLSEEGATELKCSFVSSSPNVTHYTWIKDGNILINKTGQILVLDTNEDKYGSYSCIAHNTVGSSNSTELDFTDGKVDTYGFNYLLILGVSAGVILLIASICVYIRIKARNREKEKSSHEDSQHPDATYADLVKTEISSVYETIVPPVPASGKDLPSSNQYENIPRKE